MHEVKERLPDGASQSMAHTDTLALQDQTNGS
jgi:hypothetical protein